MISMDPGTKAIGLAFWSPGGELLRALVSRGETVLEHSVHIEIATWEISSCCPHVVHVEEMQVSTGRTRNPQDLVRVSQVSAAVAGTLSSDVRWVKVSDWKGTMTKARHHPRIRKALTLAEDRVLSDCLEQTPRGLHKEALDAVGIGLWVLNRIDNAGRTRTRTP